MRIFDVTDYIPDKVLSFDNEIRLKYVDSARERENISNYLPQEERSSIQEERCSLTLNTSVFPSKGASRFARRENK